MPAEARSAIAQPDFSQIFASAAALGELLTWPSEDYLRGWGYLQPQEAPPMEYFNAFYNGTDTKLLYLFTAANIRKSSTAYQVDDVITSPNLDSKFWLVCTQAGTSDANEPDYSEVEANQEITDGTAKFLVTMRVAKGITVSDTEPDNPRDNDVWMQTSGDSKIVKLKRRKSGSWAQVFVDLILSAISDSPIKSLERSKAYVVGDICAETTLPKGGFLICTTAGTTAAAAPSAYASAGEGASVTDGTAVFKVRYLDQIASLVSPVFTGTPKAPTAAKGTNTDQIATMAALLAALADYAKLESPAFTGNPTAPTQSAGNNSMRLATTAFVQAALDTIDLSDYALKTDLNAKAPLASPALTGTPTAPTAAKTTDSTQIATTAFVKVVVADYATLTQLNAKAPLESPTFTGSPKSTTPASSDNSTSIATTAFVKALIGAANNGGIVSANLAQNGYVKFANGFILQWGLTASSATGTQPLPISFSTTNYAIVVSQSDWESNAEKYCPRVKTRNKSSFSWCWGSIFQNGNGRLGFIAAGN